MIKDKIYDVIYIDRSNPEAPQTISTRIVGADRAREFARQKAGETKSLVRIRRAWFSVLLFDLIRKEWVIVDQRKHERRCWYWWREWDYSTTQAVCLLWPESMGNAQQLAGAIVVDAEIPRSPNDPKRPTKASKSVDRRSA
jgi:hypothetical protein